MRRILVIVAGLVATPALAADQFDLVCKRETSTIRYRVDLAKNEACADTCDRVWKMGQATTGELRLIDRQPAYRGDLEERASVNRSTGEYRYHISMSGRADADSGTCEQAPFSGFPPPKF